MYTPESIVAGLLIGSRLVIIHPISKAHIVSLVPCLCFKFILVLKESREVLVANVMTKK